MTDYLSRLRRAVRKADEALGVSVFITYAGPTPIGISLTDRDLGYFYCSLSMPSRWADEARNFHEKIYRARGREVFRRQKGICALCGKKMRGTSETEIDHIKTRGAHGRDDRIENLRVVHSACHHDRHSKGARA